MNTSHDLADKDQTSKSSSPTTDSKDENQVDME